MRIALLIFLMAVPAFAKNHAIQGFHYATCSGTKCVEVWSADGEMSQLQFSFSTQGPTRVRLFDQLTKNESTYEGLSSSYLPTLECVTLSQDDGSSLVISLDTLKVERFPGFKPSSAATTQKAQL